MKSECKTMSSEVIRAINDELDYIATLPSQGRADAYDHGVAGQLVTLEEYTRAATRAWVRAAGEIPALHELRKVAAIAIRALELYGCPKRSRIKSMTATEMCDSLNEEQDQ